MAYNDDFIVKNGLVVRATTASRYQSTSTQTGAITTPGGLGIGQNAYIGGNLVAQSTATLAELQVNDITKVLSTAVNTATITPDGNALQVSGGIYAQNINIAGIGLIKGSQILTQADGFKGGVITQPLFINTTTNSTSTTTGALTTPGGIGIGQDMTIGGLLNVYGNVYSNGYQVPTLLTVFAGTGIAGGGILSATNNSITITNAGVVTLTAGTGININTATGNVTVSNVGVTSLTAGSDIAISTSTGSITVSNISTLDSTAQRGNVTGQIINITNATSNPGPTWNTTSNAFNVIGGIAAGSINILNTSYQGGAQIVTTGTINSFIGGTIQNTLHIANSTTSVSTQTGALIVDGGVGIGQSAFIGKNLNVSGNATIYGSLSVLGTYTTVIVNSTQTYLVDPFLDIGTGPNNTALPLNDGYDRGLVLHYNTGSNTLYDNHAFLGRQQSTGLLVYLTDVQPGGTTEVLTNPIAVGTYGNAKFGGLQLVGGTAATGFNTGDLQVAGGASVTGSFYAGKLYEGTHRALTDVSIIAQAGIGVTTISTAGGATVSLTNTGVLSIQLTSGIASVNQNTTGTVILTNTGVLSLTPDTLNSDISLTGQQYIQGVGSNLVIGNLATLQTVTARGNTSSAQIILNNPLASTTLSATNALYLQNKGGIYAGSIMIDSIGYINGSQIVTSATINSFSGGIINKPLTIAATLTSTSTQSGALVVNGGVGIGDDLFVQNAVTINTTLSSSTFANNSLVTYGGAAVGGIARLLNDLYVNGVIHASTLSSQSNNLYLTTGTGNGTVYANGINLLGAGSNIIYVDANGSDTNDGLRPFTGFATVKHALSVATAGTMVKIGAGTFNEAFPLIIPAGVTVQGSGLRVTVIQPTSGTNSNTGFYLNGEVVVSDLTIGGFFQPGWGFEIAPGAKVTNKSPYIERVTVLTRGSVTSATDPFGFNQADAGGGAKLDASRLDPSSLEPAVLFNEVTFIVPNATGLYMTNGVRAEYLNGFTYFANKSIDAEAGATGWGGVGKTRLRLANISNGPFTAGDTLIYKDAGGNILAQGTIQSTDGTYVYLSGPVWGFAAAINGTGKTVTPYGTAQTSTAVKKFGTASALLNGSTDYLQILSDSDFQFGQGLYTVECWIYPTSIGTVQTVFQKGNPNVAATSFGLRINADGTLRGQHGSIYLNGSTVLSSNTWYHVAITHDSSGNKATLFLGGNIEASSSSANGNVNNTDPFDIGADSTNLQWYFNGYIDEVRVSKSVRYSSSFSLATSQFNYDYNTVVLLHADGIASGVSFPTDTLEVQNVYSIGSFPGQAQQITYADYHQFGAELRCIGSAAVFGNQGVIANGTGTDLKLIAFNMSHIGVGKDITDDTTNIIQANEVIQTNGGRVYFQTVDQSGNFRVGTQFSVNQQTGAISFGSANLNLTSVSSLLITDGSGNTTNLLPGSVTVNDLNLSGSTLSSLSGNININPAGTSTIIQSNLQVQGSFSVNSLTIPSITDSTSTTTGALVVGGGAGFGGALYVGSTASSVSTVTGNAVTVLNGGIGAQTLYIAGTGFIGNARIVTTATIGQVLGGNVPNALYITTTTNSAGTNTGAFTVAGGVGIAKDLYVGGAIYQNGIQDINTINLALTGLAGNVTYAGSTATINLNNIGVTSVYGGVDISVSNNTGTVTINDSSTLQSVTNRGSSSTNAVLITNTSLSTSSIAGNAISVPGGGIGAKTLYLDTAGYIQGSQILTAGNAGSSFSGTFNNPVTIASTNNAINTQSGALQVAGGVGIGQDVWVGGTLYLSGDLFVDGSQTVVNRTSIQTGDKIITLSTGSANAGVAGGSGLQVGYSSSTAIWASFLFDGVNAWQVGNNLDPKADNTFNLGESNLRWSSVNSVQYIGGTFISTLTNYSTSTTATNTVQTQGGIGGAYLYLSKDGWINGNRIITTGNLSAYTNVFNGGTITTPLNETDPTQSASTATGAITVVGGVGIGKNLYVGGNAINLGNSYTTGTSYAAAVYDNGLRVISQINLNAGTGINLSTATLYGPGATLTVTNIGVTAITVGAGLSVNQSTGTVNIVNTGVTSITAGTDTAITAQYGDIVLWGTSTLDSVAQRGATTTASITINNPLSTTTSILGNALQVIGGIGAQSLYLSQYGYINGAQIVTTSTLNSFAGGTVNNQLIIGNTQDATSTQTGAFQVYGGVGIGKNVWIGKDLHVLGDLYVDGVNTIVNSTSIQTGDKNIYLSTLTTTAGAALNSGITIGSATNLWATFLFDGTSAWKSGADIVPSTNLGRSLGSASLQWNGLYTSFVKASATTNATNTQSGALIVTGGAGIGSDMYVGNHLIVNSNDSSTVTNTTNAVLSQGGVWVSRDLTVQGTGWIQGNQILTTLNPYDVVFTSQTQSSSTQTGSLQLAGGLGVGGNINTTGFVNIANYAESTTTAASNALQVTGGIYSDMLMVNTIATVNGAIVLTTATIGNYAFNGGTINKAVIINSSTQATSTITGAFQIINGGAGIGGNVWIGGTLNVPSNSSTFKTLYAGTATVSTASITSSIYNTSTIGGNALQVAGGIGTNYINIKTAGYVAGSPIITAANINSFSGGTINNQLTINNGTQATSTTTGALIVTNGGLGVGGNIWSGGSFDFIDPTFTVDGYFGPNAGLTAANIGTNTKNLPLAVIVNNIEVARFASTGYGVGQTNPVYAIDVLTPNFVAGTAGTMSNLLNLVSSNWQVNNSGDLSQLEVYSTSADSGVSFEHWIASGSQAAGTSQPLVFAGGSYYNNSGISTVTEWGRFNSVGNLILKNNIQTSVGTFLSNAVNTATISGNAVQALNGGVGATSLYITGKAWVAGSVVVTAATIGQYQFNGGTITSPLYINTTTQSLTPTSGALKVQGGAGINLNLNVGGSTNLTGPLTVGNATITNINYLGQPLVIGGNVTLSTATASASTGTGALVIAGGAGFASTIYANGEINVNDKSNTGTIAGNALQLPNGGIGAQTLYLAQSGYINGAQIVTSSTINNFSGGAISNPFSLTNGTQAISTQSGALTVTGGVGIGGNAWIGNDLHILGDLYVDGNQTIINTTSIQTGDKVFYLSTGATSAALASNSGIAVGPTSGVYAGFLFDGISTWQSQGNIAPNTAGGYSLGSSTNPWNTQYVQYAKISGNLQSTTATNGTVVVTGGVGISGNLNVGTSATVASTLWNINLANITQNALYVAGGIGTQYLNVANSGYINGSPIITAANIAGYQFQGGTINSILTSTNTTSAFSTTSGALQIAGGVGIGGNTWIGNAAVIGASTASAVSSTSNALYVVGGIGAYSLYLSNNGYINGSQIVTAATLNQFSGGTINSQLVINSSTQATSTTTGALQIINGGMGVGGNIYNGGVIVAGVTSNQQATNTSSGSLQVLGGAGISGNLYVGGNALLYSASGSQRLGINTNSPGQALEVNGDVVVGAYNSSRVEISNGGGANALYEVYQSETGYRWQLGRDLLGLNVAGIGFMNQSQTLSGGGAAIGAVSGLAGNLGFYTSNGSSLAIRGLIDSSGNMILGASSSPLAKFDLRGTLRVAAGNSEHSILSNNASQYVALDITRTATGNSADLRIAINGASGTFVPTANQGDATIGFSSNIIFANQATYEVGRWTPTGLVVSTATLATNASSGALQVQGGMGVTGDTWLGGTLTSTGSVYINAVGYNTSTYSTNALQVKGGIAAYSLYLQQPAWINGYQVVTTNNIGSFTGAFNGGTITQPLFVNNSANATSTSSGAIYTTGGIGITQNLYVGGTANTPGGIVSSGIVQITNSTTATSTTTGALQVNGGIGLAGNIALGTVSKLRWSSIQLTTLDTGGSSSNGSIFFNGGNTGFPGSTSSQSAVVLGAWAGPNVTGNENTLIGAGAAYNITTAVGNTAIGRNAMYWNQQGNYNTVVGHSAGSGNSTTITGMAAFGYQALAIAANGNNSAFGYQAGAAVTAGTNNALFGYQSGLTLAGGSQNVFLGYQSGQSVTSGGNNVILGGNSGSTIATSNNNVIISDGAGNIVMTAVGTTQVVQFPGVVQITNATSATSTTTGALQIQGGVGIQGDLYARNIYMSGTLVGTGSGGGGSGGSSTSTPYIVVTNGTQSYGTGTTSTLLAGTVGGMQVYGGAGVWGNLFVGIGSKEVINRSYDSSGANLQVGGDMLSSGSHIGSNFYAQGGNNLLYYSSDYSVSNSNWSKNLTSYTLSATTSPDGTADAIKLTESSATGNHYFGQSVTTTGAVTMSIFAKAADRTFCMLGVNAGGQWHGAYFNIASGATQVGFGTLYSVTSKIELVNNGWYRCTMTVWALPGTAISQVGIFSALGYDTALTGTNTSYTGTLNSGFYVYGAQLEPGYTAGAYIPTTSLQFTANNNIYASGSLYIANTATVGNAQVITTATLMTNLGLYGSSPNSLVINNATQATSTTTGALQIVNGGMGVGGNIYAGGSLYATSKSFLIDHPTKEGYKLQYGSLEGPENGVYVRGKLEGRVIQLPEYWTTLVDMDTITVDLTPIGKFQKLYVDHIDTVTGQIFVDNGALLGGTCKCFYTVWAERKDIDKLNVEFKG